MGDPLSVISGIAGIIALTATTAQALSTLIADIRDAPADILELENDIKSLENVLTNAKDIYEVHGKGIEDEALGKTFKDCLQQCLHSMESLKKLLKPFAVYQTKSGRNNSMALFGRTRWKMKKDQVRNCRDKLRDGKASLTLAVSVLNGYVTGRGHDEIRRNIVTVFEQLHKEFLSLDRGMLFKDQLTNDLESISGRDITDNSTDVGITMQKFLEAPEDWVNITVPQEPPPIEAIEDSSSVAVDQLSPNFDAISLDRSNVTPYTTSSLGIYTLTKAVSLGNTLRVKELLASGASLQERNEQGQTALHICAELNDKSIADLLLDNGANMNVKDHDRRTPFAVALEQQSVEVACLLIERGCSLGNFIIPLLIMLKENNYSEDTRRILHSLATRLNKEPHATPILHTAVQRNEDFCVQVLLKEGFDSNAKDEGGICAIHYAVMQSNRSVIKTLAAFGADLNAYIPNGTHPTLPGTTDRDYTPLLIAASVICRPDIIHLLIDQGANPNFILSSHNEVALEGVCAYDVSIGRALVEGGTNVNYTCPDGHTPVWWACCCNNTPLVRLLLDHGADINKAPNDDEAKPPLHIALERKNENLTKMLIERGADVNSKDAQGNTPLLITIERNMPRLAELLLKKGAGNVKDSGDRRKIIANARDKGMQEILRLLEENGWQTDG